MILNISLRNGFIISNVLRVGTRGISYVFQTTGTESDQEINYV